MDNKIRNTSIAILVLALLFSPFAYVVVYLGMGSANEGGYFTIMFFAYLGVVAFASAPIFNRKFFVALLVSIIAGAFGFALDLNYAQNNQDKGCREVRANPNCVEDVCGFTCVNRIDDEYGAICKDKDLSRCPNTKIF
jgi:hypothetical protein